MFHTDDDVIRTIHKNGSIGGTRLG